MKNNNDEVLLRRVIIELLAVTQKVNSKDSEMVEALHESLVIFRNLYKKRYKGVKLPPQSNLKLVKE